MIRGSDMSSRTSRRKSRQLFEYDNASLETVLALIQDLDVRVVQEVPDRTEAWTSWTIQSGGRTCRVERPRVETDRYEVVEYTWKKKPVREVEFTHDRDAVVPCHWWLVNSGGRGSGTYRSAVDIASGIRAVLEAGTK